MDIINIRKETKKCSYNNQVDCNINTCWRCGWNPSVAQARINKVLRVRAQRSIRDVMCFA